MTKIEAIDIIKTLIDNNELSNENIEAFKIAIDTMKIPKLINKCNCIFEDNILREAIKCECRRKNIFMKDTYNIVLHNGYPTIVISHKKIYIHRLIGRYIFGRIRNGYIIHHKDFNKLNNLQNNLELMSSKKHLKIHSEAKKGFDFRSEDGKWRGIKAAAKKRYKDDITLEKINTYICNDYSIPQIASELNCSENTIRRRLGMKT